MNKKTLIKYKNTKNKYLYFIENVYKKNYTSAKKIKLIGKLYLRMDNEKKRVIKTYFKK